MEQVEQQPQATEQEVPEQESKTFSEDYVKELRKESANYRTKLREAETQVESFSQREKDLRTKEFELAAKSAGAVDPQTLLKLVDMESEGNPDEIVQQLLQEKPFLKGGSIGKPTNPVGGNGEPKIYSRQDLDGMSQEEIKRNWGEIQSQMTRGLIR